MSLRTRSPAILLTAALVAPASVAWAATASATSSNTVTAVQTAPANAKTRYTKYVTKVRSGPGTSYKVVATIPKGTLVTVVSTKNGWAKIWGAGDPPAKATYIRSDLLTATKPKNFAGCGFAGVGYYECSGG